MRKTDQLQLLSIGPAQVRSSASRSLPPAHFNLTVCIFQPSQIFSNAYLKSTLQHTALYSSFSFAPIFCSLHAYSDILPSCYGGMSTLCASWRTFCQVKSTWRRPLVQNCKIIYIHVAQSMHPFQEKRIIEERNKIDFQRNIDHIQRLPTRMYSLSRPRWYWSALYFCHRLKMACLPTLALMAWQKRN